MSDQAPGRPSAGVLLKEGLADEANRRPRRRDLRPLRRLWPFVRAHSGDALLALMFLLVSTAASLALTGAARMVVNAGFEMHTYAALHRTFAVVGAVVVVLALATAFRFYFVSKVGERVVADLRKVIYDHVLTLDQAFFLKTRTG